MVIAAVRSAEEFLAPLGRPSDRPTEPPGGKERHHPFRINEVLHAEAAADIRGLDPDALRRHVKNGLRQLIADAVHALAGQEQVEGVRAWIVAADRGARLDCGRHDPVVHKIDLDHMRRRRESRVDRRLVAALKAEAEIARRLIPDRGRVRRQGCRGIDNGGERTVIDNDPFSGVARQIAGQRHDKRHRIADMAHPVPRQRRPRRDDRRFEARHLRHAGQSGRSPRQRDQPR